MNLLVAAGADVHQPDEDGWTALHCAAISGQAVLVPLLLDVGANIACKTLDGETPLHLAIISTCTDMVGFISLLQW